MNTSLFNKIMTIIGTRKDIPSHVEQLFVELIRHYNTKNYLVRSGAAKGVDSYAIKYATNVISYLPKDYFNGYSPKNDTQTHKFIPLSLLNTTIVKTAYHIATLAHSDWSRVLGIQDKKIREFAILAHTRNVFQVLGHDLKTPSNAVIAYSRLDKQGNPTGGTATAINIAKMYDIKVFNLADEATYNMLAKALNFTPKKVAPKTVKEKVINKPKEVKKQQVTKGTEHNKPVYECSSKGDKNFSAFYARINKYDKKSIEYLYQVGIKGHKSIKEGKGKAPKHTHYTKRDQLMMYRLLWFYYLQENTPLISKLQQVLRDGYRLNDMFATKGGLNQATELNNLITSTPEELQKLHEEYEPMLHKTFQMSIDNAKPKAQALNIRDNAKAESMYYKQQAGEKKRQEEKAKADAAAALRQEIEHDEQIDEIHSIGEMPETFETSLDKHLDSLAGTDVPAPEEELDYDIFEPKETDECGIYIKNMKIDKFDPKVPHAVRVDRGHSPLANPFKLDKYTREESISKYADWLDDKYFKYSSAARGQIELLARQYLHNGALDLYCWCAPEKCHAEVIRDTIIYYIENDMDKEEIDEIIGEAA